MFIFEKVRETEREQEKSRERERETESEAGSRLWAVSTEPEPEAGLEPMNRDIMTWAEVGRVTHWATQAPLGF